MKETLERNEIKLFEKEEFGTIRTVIIDGEPWFVATDVCKDFGNQKYNRCIKKRIRRF